MSKSSQSRRQIRMWSRQVGRSQCLCSIPIFSKALYAWRVYDDPHTHKIRACDDPQGRCPTPSGHMPCPAHSSPYVMPLFLLTPHHIHHLPIHASRITSYTTGRNASINSLKLTLICAIGDALRIQVKAVPRTGKKTSIKADAWVPPMAEVDDVY